MPSASPLRASTLEPQLTERELQVLTFVPCGLSNAEIARQLDITVATVEGHLNSIYSKLNVPGSGPSRRVAAAIRALQLRLIRLEQIEV